MARKKRSMKKSPQAACKGLKRNSFLSCVKRGGPTAAQKKQQAAAGKTTKKRGRKGKSALAKARAAIC